MECPRCKRPVNEGDYICSRCGKRLKYPETLKNDLVFSSKDMPKPRKNIGKRIVIVLIAAIVICGVVLGTMLYMQRESGKDKPVKKAETTTVAAGTAGSTEKAAKQSRLPRRLRMRKSCTVISARLIFMKTCSPKPTAICAST